MWRELSTKFEEIMDWLERRHILQSRAACGKGNLEQPSFLSTIEEPKILTV